MITILFFAQVRELVGTGMLSLPAEYQTVEALRQALCERGERWALALESGKLLMAVNQSLVAAEHPLRAGDEVAFFPPVTGG
ncbi:molybdopterin synthase subunit MoaD [Serratia fonticola]|jgi:molybdopterin synthase sulfur carrier subunit|uniref:Molybdopterin synthase sulfur carrier subunit n=1 Tax=Serratia fonticola TaxID=47917 RepID=A0A559T015_SERFO|nr:molybdopterin synthase sulfur carrier subunit [Serratia fonticola]TQI79553.1 molybdopterin synthase subunit MoaD [Serratia fonticola]TQI98422.1 molybdopterin synthase subunit MoaD [Serratia fonticola]TVZ67950.1 molybdopterin synthase subunit MoaD [Serratia fonticola]